MRPLLSGDFHPLTECTLEIPWLAYQFHRTDLDRGFALVFKRNASGGNTFRLAPRALDPNARCAMRFEAAGSQAIHTSAELAKGIAMTLKPAPDAELVRYERLP